MKKILGMLAVCCAALAGGTIHAHGVATPNHGGVVQTVGETWLELVTRGDTLELYVQDDGEDLPSADMSGKLTIVDSAGKKEVALKPAGGNKLEARGAAGKGAKVLALLTLADKKTRVSTTFVLK